MSTTLCLSEPADSVPLGPSVDNLSYSFGLPGGAYCAGLARATVRQLLPPHGLGDLVPLAELIVSELLGCAYRFAPDRGVNLSLRCRYESLRVTVFDQHQDGVTCRERRLNSLVLLAAVMERCGGAYGTADAEPPLSGARMWAVVPLEGAYRYGWL